MKKLYPNYTQSALCWEVQTFGIRKKEVLTSAASLIPVITGSELDAFPRHPKYQHVTRIRGNYWKLPQSMMI